MFSFYHFICLLLAIQLSYSYASQSNTGNKVFELEGQLVIPTQPEGVDIKEIFLNTRVTVGTRYGFVKNDGRFIVSNVPSGSFLLEVNSPKFEFPQVRLDINARTGRIKARRLDPVRPNDVSTDSALPYPLKLSPDRPKDYFEPRQAWTISSLLMHPMVLMLILPALLMLVLPKLMSSMDPGAQKEMEESMQKLQSGKDKMPELADLFTNWFGGGASGGDAKKSLQQAKKKKN